MKLSATAARWSDIFRRCRKLELSANSEEDQMLLARLASFLLEDPKSSEKLTTFLPVSEHERREQEPLIALATLTKE